MPDCCNYYRRWGSNPTETSTNARNLTSGLTFDANAHWRSEGECNDQRWQLYLLTGIIVDQVEPAAEAEEIPAALGLEPNPPAQDAEGLISDDARGRSLRTRSTARHLI